MNDQPTPPNSAAGGERSGGARPEDLQAGNLEQAPAVEAAPMPGSSPTPPPAASATGGVPAPAKLSAGDVAKALAATPGPTPPPGTATPSVAGDVDVIEPEWVNKAENVVAQHQGDPYGEEEAIEELQQDYLKKRYGYDVANPNSDSSKPEGT